MHLRRGRGTAGHLLNRNNHLWVHSRNLKSRSGNWCRYTLGGRKTFLFESGQWLILATSICLGLFLSFLDTSIVATAIYTIGDDFQSLSKVNWIALAYTLAYIGCTAIFASVSDVSGRRNAYLAASVIFLAFSIGCGFAQSLNQLIALRALQGVGGSGLYSVGFVILPEISSLRMTKMIGALAGAVIAMSGILGPVLGGIITNYTTVSSRILAAR